jgi:hypothetical protein
MARTVPSPFLLVLAVPVNHGIIAKDDRKAAFHIAARSRYFSKLRTFGENSALSKC